MLDRVLLRFLAVGAGNTALGFGVIALGEAVTGSPVIGNLVGYLLVVPVSFYTHRRHSFQHRGEVPQAFIRYLPVVACGYLVNVVTLVGLTTAGAPPMLAQAGAISIYVIGTYVASRFFVFKA